MYLLGASDYLDLYDMSIYAFAKRPNIWTYVLATQNAPFEDYLGPTGA